MAHIIKGITFENLEVAGLKLRGSWDGAAPAAAMDEEGARRGTLVLEGIDAWEDLAKLIQLIGGAQLKPPAQPPAPAPVKAPPRGAEPVEFEDEEDAPVEQVTQAKRPAPVGLAQAPAGNGVRPGARPAMRREPVQAVAVAAEPEPRAETPAEDADIVSTESGMDIDLTVFRRATQMREIILELKRQGATNYEAVKEGIAAIVEAKANDLLVRTKREGALDQRVASACTMLKIPGV